MPQLKVTPATNRIQFSLRYVRLIHALTLQEPTSNRANTAMCMARSAVTLSPRCPFHLLSSFAIKRFSLKFISAFVELSLEPMMHEEPSEL